MEGKLIDTEEGPVVLKTAPGNGSFVGDVKVWSQGSAENSQRVTLVGVLRFFDNIIQVNKTLSCQEKYRE
nr:hypothetical protein HAGR004_40890 [Bdellovibrio sp. HAGR004]